MESRATTRARLVGAALHARGAAGRWLRPHLEVRVRSALEPRRVQVAASAQELAAVASRLPPLRARIAELRARGHAGALTPDMTVHALLHAHPGAARALAAQGLPDCGSCAVGADETLAEAARLEGFDLDGLLSTLSHPVST